MTIFLLCIVIAFVVVSFGLVLWAIQRQRNQEEPAQQAEPEQQQAQPGGRSPFRIWAIILIGLIATGLIGAHEFQLFGKLGSIGSDVSTANGNIIATHDAVQQNGQQIGQVATDVAKVQNTANDTLAKAQEIRRNQTENYNLLRRRIGQARHEADLAVKRLVKEINKQQ